MSSDPSLTRPVIAGASGILATVSSQQETAIWTSQKRSTWCTVASYWIFLVVHSVTDIELFAGKREAVLVSRGQGP